jgi:hypothetical protein
MASTEDHDQTVAFARQVHVGDVMMARQDYRREVVHVELPRVLDRIRRCVDADSLNQVAYWDAYREAIEHDRKDADR